jgi:hypothetical protein
MKLQGIAFGYVVMFPKTDGGRVQMGGNARPPPVA